MAKIPYPVLQSGFVGLNNTGLTLPDPIEPTVRETVIFKAFKPPLQAYYYSNPVVEIFNRWSARPVSIKNFEFRERILKTFFQCFGSRRFREWLAVQLESGQMSGLHQKFLLETLEFALTGKRRKIECIQWVNLLEAGPVTMSIRVNPDEFYQTKKELHNDVRIPMDLTEILLPWLTQNGGFEDVLITLYVIFGSRLRQTDVVDLGH